MNDFLSEEKELRQIIASENTLFNDRTMIFLTFNAIMMSGLVITVAKTGCRPMGSEN